jgi:hypothetical protein
MEITHSKKRLEKEFPKGIKRSMQIKLFFKRIRARCTGFNWPAAQEGEGRGYK